MGNRTLGNMRFGPPKNFLVKACYYIMNYGGVTVLVNTDIWNLPVPKNVKKFAWLVFHNKINTKKIVSITTPINPPPNKTSPSPHAAYTVTLPPLLTVTLPPLLTATARWPPLDRPAHQELHGHNPHGRAESYRFAKGCCLGDRDSLKKR
jgi:hypothetical protein